MSIITRCGSLETLLKLSNKADLRGARFTRGARKARPDLQLNYQGIPDHNTNLTCLLALGTRARDNIMPCHPSRLDTGP
jgi:hypothetical protein